MGPSLLSPHPSSSLLGDFIRSFSGHTQHLCCPDVGSRASELGGSGQDSPACWGHIDKACAVTLRPRGEVRSSGCGGHGRLFIRDGEMSWSSPSRCGPSLEVRQEPHVSLGTEAGAGRVRLDHGGFFPKNQSQVTLTPLPFAKTLQ